MPKPSIGRIVHYTSYGTPNGEYGQVCRAAVITEVIDDVTVSLAVLNPTGMFFNVKVPLDAFASLGGTWHWPERVPE